MSAAFTPGPWRVGRAGPNLCPTVGTYQGLMTAMVTHGDGHSTQANAHLIAAAPELYEALENLMASDGARGTYDASKAFDAKAAAERALAKAQGMEAGTAATGTGAVHDSPVAKPCAQSLPGESHDS